MESERKVKDENRRRYDKQQQQQQKNDKHNNKMKIITKICKQSKSHSAKSASEI